MSQSLPTCDRRYLCRSSGCGLDGCSVGPLPVTRVIQSIRKHTRNQEIAESHPQGAQESCRSERSRESLMVRRRPMVAQQCFVSFFHVCLLGEVRGLFKSRSSSASRGPFSSRTNTTKAATFLQVWFGAVSHRQSLQGMCRSGFTSGHPRYHRGFHTIHDSFMRGHITDEEMKDWPDEDPRKAGLLVRFFHPVWSVSLQMRMDRLPMYANVLLRYTNTSVGWTSRCSRCSLWGPSWMM